MRILVIRFSSIGDIVNTSAVVRCLRNKWPNAEIGFATKQQFATLIKPNPMITRVHELDTDFGAFAAEIKEHNYTHVLDLHNNLRSRRLTAKLHKTAVLRFNKWNLRKWLKVHGKWDTLPMVHINTRYFNALKRWNVEYDMAGLSFFIAPNETLPDMLTLPARYVAVAIGGTYATKRLPAHELQKLIALLPLPAVLIGGTADAAVGELICKNTGAINTCGKLSIMQSALLVKNAEAVLSHDTGFMHIAAALNKPLLSIWGSTIREFGFFPLRSSTSQVNTVFLENINLDCRPCSKLGYEQCPKGHFKCMQFTAAQMQQKINELFE